MSSSSGRRAPRSVAPLAAPDDIVRRRSAFDREGVSEFHLEQACPARVGDLDIMVEVEMAMVDAHARHVAGIVDRLGAGRFDIGKLAAFLVRNIHVVVKMEVEDRHDGWAISGGFPARSITWPLIWINRR